MKRLLLLGGGHAHVHVLDTLAREPLVGAQAVLVTPFARQMYSGMVPGLVAGHYAAEACAIPLAPLAAAAGVEMVEASAVALDAAGSLFILPVSAGFRPPPIDGNRLGVPHVCCKPERLGFAADNDHVAVTMFHVKHAASLNFS